MKLAVLYNPGQYVDMQLQTFNSEVERGVYIDRFNKMNPNGQIKRISYDTDSAEYYCERCHKDLDICTCMLG